MASIEQEIEEFRSREDSEASAQKFPEQIISEVAAEQRSGAKDSKVTPEERADALSWFLSDTDDSSLEHSFEINVGGVEDKKWVTWTVKPVDMDRLRKLRRQAQPKTRRGLGQQDFDEVAANVAIVVEGTVNPDLRAAAKQIGIVDPGSAVRSRFAHKPGLVAQIASEIMNVSGYDDEDVREVDAALG